MTPALAVRLVWLLWLIAWIAAAVWTAPTVTRPNRTREVTYRVVTALGAILLFLPSQAVLWHLGWFAGWFAVLLATLGLLFTWWARLHLGSLWSSGVTRKAGHRVVDTGPYGWVRHPIYTGTILATLAAAAIFGTVPAVIGAALLTFGWYIKARLEERWLTGQLGEDYRTYERRVPMLVPLARTVARRCGLT